MARSKVKTALKVTLLGCGGLALVVVAVAVWMIVKLSRGPGEVELTAHHPFRSPEAKARYLELYDRRAEAWPVPSETREVETSYGSTFVRVSGPREAPPLVLLPGGNATSLMWVPNIEALSAGFRTYAVDNIYDFGRSVYTRPMRTPEDFVAWLDELHGGLGLSGGIRLMGLSYGGWIASQYALRHPEKLDKLVLVAPAATVLPLRPEFLQRAILGLLPHSAFVRGMIAYVAEDAMKSGEEGRRLMEQAADDLWVAMRTFEFKQLVNPTILTDEELAGLAVPTLFLVGENEKIYLAGEAVERLARVAPQIRTEVLSGAGHDLTVVRADEVNRAAIEFLGGAAP